ncbi:MAG: HPr kinase/phosphorylase [Sphingomonadaceae bacterium]
MIVQASCVAIGERAILIEGVPASGKSSLALSLIDRGAVLVGDDGVMLERDGNRIMASPPPNIRGLLEIRNVGLVPFPVTKAPLALIIRIDKSAPRHRDMPENRDISGCQIPLIPLYPAGAIMALRAEQALRIYGLP